jgi:hypothetical protein
MNSIMKPMRWSVTTLAAGPALSRGLAGAAGAEARAGESKTYRAGTGLAPFRTPPVQDLVCAAS